MYEESKAMVGQEKTTTQCKESQEVRIRKVANGFIVKVGCQEFVADSWITVYEGLAQYWTDPEAARLKYTRL